MDPSKHIRDSFRFAWRHKLLWPAAFFLNPSIYGIRFFNTVTDPTKGFPWHEVLRVGFWLMVVGFFLLFVVALVNPLLVLVVKDETVGRRRTLGEVIPNAMDFYWRCYGLIWVFALAGILAMGIAALPAFFAFRASIVLGVLVSMPLLGILVLLGAAGAVINNYSVRFIALENTSIADSISQGISLFRHNLGKSVLLLIFTLFIPLGIGFAISMILLPLEFILALPKFLGENFIFDVSTAAAVILMVIISVIVSGYTGLFSSSLWTLGFLDLQPPLKSEVSFVQAQE